MRTLAVILAAGRGTRFGEDKVRLPLGDRAVWQWSYRTFVAHPQVSEVLIVTGEEFVEETIRLAPEALGVVAGGETRKQSAQKAIPYFSGFDAILIHDAARPFVSAEVISRVMEALETNIAAAAALPVSDTIKQRTDAGIRHLDRTQLWAMQTPQGARTSELERAYSASAAEATDEMQMLGEIGVEPVFVMGDESNFKITTVPDLTRAQLMVAAMSETRTGIGYDIHAFSANSERVLWLGGVMFRGHRALEGHSDADVLLHAITDAILGAIAKGDIGQHFPNTDPQWCGEPSLTFLSHAAAIARADGWTVLNIDATVIAETPKVMQRAVEIRQRIASALGLELDRVSLKATTNEGLGSIGRSEGISAFAVATLRRP